MSRAGMRPRAVPESPAAACPADAARARKRPVAAPLRARRHRISSLHKLTGRYLQTARHAGPATKCKIPECEH